MDFKQTTHGKAYKKLEDELCRQDQLLDAFRHFFEAKKVKEIESKATKAGPPRVTVASRLELRMRIEDLQDKLANFREGGAPQAARASTKKENVVFNAPERTVDSDLVAKVSQQRKQLQAQTEQIIALETELRALRLEWE